MAGRRGRRRVTLSGTPVASWAFLLDYDVRNIIHGQT